jgi:hypothetical protein
MSDLVLIVKGNREEASKALWSRNIPFTFVREYIMNETVVSVSTTNRDKVMKWFGETNKPPFVTGDLLSISDGSSISMDTRP